jgi:hypothetical protein
MSIQSMETVVGSMTSILAIANLLENTKVKFKIADVSGFVCNQKQMGCGDFRYWMEEKDSF